jgi:3-oxoacyl-[acyl-carrier-protein] synthase II
MKLNRVVVTGIGALTPIGNNVQDFFDGLKNSKSGSNLITRFDASKFRTRFAAELKGFSPESFMDKKEARKVDPFVQYALYSTEEAMQDSGLLESSFNADRCGVIWGSGIGGIRTFIDEVSDFAHGDGTPRFNPFFIPKMIIDLSSGHISIKYGFRGVNFSTVSACATSANSIGEAFNYIRFGKADVVISGGSEAAINEAAIGGFNAMRALSENNDNPETASRPFDKTRDGFVLGEGSCTLILENLEHAKARGAKIYAEIVGYGVSADAYHITAPHPEGTGVTLVMKNALEDANLNPEQIDYINVHGTSTPLGDIAELKAISKVFGEHAYQVDISSTKSMTGHLLGAAGAIEALASILALQENIIPPTINHFEDDDEIDPRFNLTFNTPKHKEVNYVMSNAFGFGGHNVSLIFTKYKD